MKQMKTNETIKKIIEKARTNGWKNAPIWDDQMDWAYYSDQDGGFVVASIEQIIFNHEFAKAFWGTETTSIGDYEGVTYANGGGTFKEIFKPAWQYHLTQMVLETDPVAYLERFI